LAFNVPYTTELYRTEVEVILNVLILNIRVIGLGEGIHRKYKEIELGGGEAYDRSTD
jgi:hypothetical protein